MTHKHSIALLISFCCLWSSSFTLPAFAQDNSSAMKSKDQESLLVNESTQENPGFSQKNEEINQQVFDTLSANETLVEVEKHKELILNDEETDWDIIKSIPRDTWELIKAPAGWDKKEWFIASGVVTMTTLLMVGDKRVQEFFQSNRTDFTEGVAYWAEKGGSQAHIGLAASYIVGTIIKNKKLKKASLLAFSSMIISGVLVQGMKQLFGRVRPYAAADQWEFHGPGIRSSRYNSFPSGHTTSAFAVAATISTIYDNKLVKILAYTAAALTGLSRIHDNKHWMSDVFMGAVFGTATGMFIAKRHMSTSNKTFELSPAIINSQNQNFYGVSLRINLGNGKKKKKRKLP